MQIAVLATQVPEPAATGPHPADARPQRAPVEAPATDGGAN
jgi:hypothetical protein